MRSRLLAAVTVPSVLGMLGVLGVIAAPLAARAQQAAPPEAPPYAPPPSWANGPKKMPYEEGQPIPAGYRVEQERRKGLIIGGSITFGVAWLATAIIAAFDTHREVKDVGLVPVVAPFLALASGKVKSGDEPVWLGAGLVQAGGVAMLAIGIVVKREVLVRNDVAGFDWSPALAPGYAGVRLGWRF